MLVMVSNQCGNDVGFYACKYPGLIGHLYSPGGERGPWEYLPFALDNGAFSAWEHNVDWDEAAWRALIAWALKSGQRPLWVLVPDVVADRDRTLERWEQYSRDVYAIGLRPAFAVQDGMTFADVPDGDCMLFIGGSTGWKLKAIEPWCARFPGRVHVGRVNTWDRLIKCYEAGAVSVDGTGWFRKTNKPGQRIQANDLRKFFEMASQQRRAA